MSAGDATVSISYSKSGFISHSEPKPHDPVVVLIMRRDPSEAARALVDWLGAQTA